MTYPKSTLNYRSNQTLFAESHVVPSPRSWELDESHKIHLVVDGTSSRALALAKLPLDLELSMKPTSWSRFRLVL
jgi:hypothetical protein